MSSQTTLEDERAFEELLLGAGRAEAVPREQTEAALLRFAAGVAALQGGTLGATATNGAASAASGGTWARLAATAKWVSLGFIVGGIATFAWLERATPANTSRAPEATPAANVQLNVAPAASVPTADPQPSSEPTQSAPTEAERAVRTANANAAPRSATKPSSDLVAEVAAIDAIRTALSIGAWRDAEKQLARYRRDFAAGALSSEAEVLAIEVLLANGQKPAASRAGQRFLSKHPRDPQVARVRTLLE